MALLFFASLPDGKNIAFWSNDSLRKVSIAEGAVERLAPARTLAAPPTLHWAADNTIYYFSDQGRLMRIAASGGTASAITEPDQKTPVLSVGQQLLPDGEHLLQSEFAPDGGQLVALNPGASLARSS